MTTPATSESWFGGSIAAGENTLFTCAYRYGFRTFTPNSQFIGKCFKLERERFQDLISFAQGKFQVDGSSTFKNNGVYGFSAAVLDGSSSDKLIVGSPVTFDHKGKLKKL